jgi:hypothetical protein
METGFKNGFLKKMFFQGKAIIEYRFLKGADMKKQRKNSP